MLFGSELFSWPARLNILWSSLGSLNTSFGAGSRLVIMALSVLSGINVAMLTFYF